MSLAARITAEPSYTQCAGLWLYNMFEQLVVRKAAPADAAVVSSLIVSVAHCFIVNPTGEGAERFFATISTEAIAGYISSPNFNYLTAFLGGRVVGVVAMRDAKHLFHLFIARDFQRRGLGRLLWQRAQSDALAAGNREGFTVNSSPYAVPFYECLGFRATSSRVEKDGIAFVPMKREAGNCNL